MKTTDVWKSHTFSIKNKAFKEVRPLNMTINPEVEYESTGFFFWRESKEYNTGRYIISLQYDRGPLTFPQTSHIYFDSTQEANQVYKDIFQMIFLPQSDPPPPPPPPPPRKKTNKTIKLPVKGKKKGSPLRLV